MIIKKIFFFFCFSTIYAQEVIVLDLITKEEIPYVAIKYTKDIGFYTIAHP